MRSTDPIPEAALRRLWASYATGVDTDEVFQDALTWALRPVTATIALLQRTRGYLAYDYVIRLVNDKPSAQPPADPAWAAAIESATPPQALTVGVAAYHHARHTDAVTAFTCARESSDIELAALAGHNLGPMPRSLV